MLKLLILLLITTVGVHSRCSESDQIECGTDDRCVRIAYICDGDNDCGDHSDEASDLCREWRSSECSRGEAYCQRRDGYSSCVSMETYCDSHNEEPCEGDVDRRLCVMLQERKIRPLDEIVLPESGSGPLSVSDVKESIIRGEDFMENIENTLKHEGCPQLYTKIGNDCLSLFFFGNLTWGEARSFCQSIKGDLWIPSDIVAFNTVVSHLKKHRMTSNFWMGGTYNGTTGWHWINEEPIDLDTAHWAVRFNQRCETRQVYIEYRNATVEANDGLCYNYVRAPAGEVPRGGCIASTYDKFYLLSDEDCLSAMSPLCKLKA